MIKLIFKEKKKTIMKMYQKSMRRLDISHFLKIIINYKKESKTMKETLTGINKYDWKVIINEYQL